MRKTLKNFKKLERKVVTIMLSLALVVSGLFVAPAHAAIKSDTPHTDTVSGNELLNLADKKPEGYDETSDKNPYNIGKEEKGAMAISTEEFQALKWDPKDRNNNPIKIRENYTFNASDDPLDDFENTTSSHTDFLDPDDGDDRGIYRSVSFDEGDARKKDIAYTAYNNDNHKIELWVSDAEQKTDKVKVNIDMESGWDNIIHACDEQIFPNHRGNGENFLNITSGDFDGDGVETIILASVWRKDGKNTGFLFEYKYDPLTVSLERVGNPYVVYSEIEELRSLNITAGDLDGDRLDELCVMDAPISGTSNNDIAANLSVFKGVENTSIFSNRIYEGEQKSQLTVDDNDFEITFAGPALDCGDTDSDGTDELVVGGLNLRNQDDKYLEKDQMQLLGLYDLKDDTVKVRCLSPVEPNAYYATDNNGRYTDEVIIDKKTGPTFLSSVATVAFCGSSGPETIFFNGSLFEFTEDNEKENTWGEPSDVPTMFNQEDSEKDTEAGVERVQSVAVGNFSDDPMGHESIICSMAVDDDILGTFKKEQSDRVGAISATYQVSEDKTATIVDSYVSSTETRKIQNIDYGDTFIPGDDTFMAAQTFHLTSCDNDHDGLLLRYNKKDFIYTDPQVQAVLQAAPYFPGVQNAGSTSYGVSTTYSSSKTEETTHSWNAGFYARGSVGLFAGAEYAFKAGYVGSKKTVKEYGASTSYTATFRASKNNTVIVNRTPVVSYYYDVWDNENSQWVECGISVPTNLTPVYSQLTIPDYNEFIDQYNQIAAQNASVVGPDYEMPTLGKIEGKVSGDNGQYLLDNEGNPSNYVSTWSGAALDNSANLSNGYDMNLDYAGSNKTIEWEHDESESSSETWSHGAQFYAEFGVKFDAGVYEQHAGGYGGYEYIDGKTKSKSTTKGHTVSGTVSDIDAQELEDKGISD
ncbi:MAG: hypothetical protein J6W35_01250, partial [Eubacterium sp.]|nr:hypothetical protein [Eubacterium sp.]